MFLITKPVGATLDDAALVVQALNKGERDLVSWLSVRGDAVPMLIDHLGKLLVRFPALPLQARMLVLEESTRSTLPVVVPQLPETFLEEEGDVDALVGREQRLQRTLALKGEILSNPGVGASDGRTSSVAKFRTRRAFFRPPPHEVYEAYFWITGRLLGRLQQTKPGKVYISVSRRRGGCLAYRGSVPNLSNLALRK